MSKIDSKDISVVVQGAVDKDITPKCLESIRKYLPEAEIILSTWEGTDVSGLEYDIVLLNKDPGAFLFGEGDKKNNNNRMILSTSNGLSIVNRKYTLKIRSDMILLNNNICKIKDKYSRISKYRLFKNRIIVNDTYSIKYEENSYGEKHWRPFHISDWLFFGLTSDIKILFNIPLAKEPETSRYFEIHKMPKNKFHRFPHLKWRMSPEQYVTSICAIKNFPNIKFKHILDYNDKNIKQSEIFIVNNFIILSKYDLGIINAKARYLHLDIKNDENCKNGFYSKKVWLQDYQKYCDPKFKLPIRYTYKEKLKIGKYLTKLNKHYHNFITPIRKFLRWLLEPLSILMYCLKILIRFLTRFYKLF